jgi:hypothetical protein
MVILYDSPEAVCEIRIIGLAQPDDYANGGNQ